MSRWITVLLATVAFAAGMSLNQLREQSRSDSATQLLRDNHSENVTASALAQLSNIAALHELADAYAPAAPFWKSDNAAELQRLADIRAAEHNVRAALIDHYGPSVTKAPVLWRLFRPLGDRMPQLSSSEQLAIHDLEQELLAAALSSARQIDFADLLLSMRERVGAQITNEYALRMSPLAKELREAAFDLSEAEFRDTFAGLNVLSEAGSPEEFLAARSTLRELLGARRFAQLWARRDPRYVRIDSTARRLGLDKDQTMTAWTMLLESQDLMLAAMADGHAGHRQELARSQYENTRRRLRELFGARAADALMQVAMSRPDERPVRLR